MLPWIGLTAAGVAVTLVGEARGQRTLIWVAKPLASVGFIGAAVASGATRSPYGVAILIGLGLSLLGDVFLIPRTRIWFLAGLVSFLLGHLAFAAAFAVRG